MTSETKQRMNALLPCEFRSNPSAPARDQRNAEAYSKTIDQEFRLRAINDGAVRLCVCAGLRFEYFLRNRNAMPDRLPAARSLNQAAEGVRILTETDNHGRKIRTGNSKVGLVRDGGMYRCDLL